MDVITILKDIHYREEVLERMKKFVADLDEERDNRYLDRTTSKKSVLLYTMTQELEKSTNECCESIEKFMAVNKRFYGSCFNYEGTEFLKSS